MHCGYSGPDQTAIYSTVNPEQNKGGYAGIMPECTIAGIDATKNAADARMKQADYRAIAIAAN
jgi:hypothetical protein